MPGLYDDLQARVEKKGQTDPAFYEQLNDQLQGEGVPPLLEHLNRQLDDKTSGLTPVDLMTLRGAAKSIMLMLIRDTQAVTEGVTYDELRQKLSDIPENLEAVLTELAEQGWLLVFGEAPQIRYRVHMRRKKGKESFGIWSSLRQHLGK